MCQLRHQLRPLQECKRKQKHLTKGISSFLSHLSYFYFTNARAINQKMISVISFATSSGTLNLFNAFIKAFLVPVSSISQASAISLEYFRIKSALDLLHKPMVLSSTHPPALTIFPKPLIALRVALTIFCSSIIP